MTFKERFRVLLIKTLVPIIKIIGKIKAPYSVKPAITTWYHWIDKIEPLDVLLVNTYGHLSNVFNDGLAKHAVLFIGWEGEQKIPMIIEAIGEGVIKRPLIECMAEKDTLIGIARYNGNKVNMDIYKGIKFANWTVGRPYDFRFEESSEDIIIEQILIETGEFKLDEKIQSQSKFESFFCSELCYWAWKFAYPNCSFTKRKILGVDTVQPTDFIDASIHGKTVIIFDGRKM